MSSRNMLVELYKDSRTVFTMQNIQMKFPDRDTNSLRQSLFYAKRQGLILNPRSGIYAKPGYDEKELACAIFWPSYLSLNYVLAKAGVIYQFDSSIQCVSYLSRVVTVDSKNYEYRRIKPELIANCMGIIQKNGYAIATPERAFVDSVYLNPQSLYFDRMDILNRESVMEIAESFEKKSLIKKISEICYGRK